MANSKYVIGAVIIGLIIFCYAFSTLDIYSSLPTLNFNQKNYTEIHTVYENRPKLFPCEDHNAQSHYGQRGSYWVLYNYVTATKIPACDESITYTTHSDFTYLDNLAPLMERWRGPISVSVYAPGSDFEATVTRIHFMRECATPLIKEFVNFHLFFESSQTPPKIPPFDSTPNLVNCSEGAPTFGDNVTQTFRKLNKMTYPINVARNLARDMAPTHFVLASDIELYPSPNLIPEFLEMIKNSEVRNKTNPQLWVLPIFEVDGSIPLTELPMDKGQLQNMLNKTTAIPFHKFICSFCHKIPKQNEWIAQKYELEDGLQVFHTGKRQGAFRNWEPIYIGTKLDPGYDERLSWEGQRDKMTQGYILCVQNYDFNILNHAFLIHRPGIKRPKKGRRAIQRKGGKPDNNWAIKNSIIPELKILYGSRDGCVV